MTGFGKAEVAIPDKKITVEIRTLNSKQLDTLLTGRSLLSRCLIFKVPCLLLSLAGFHQQGFYFTIFATVCQEAFSLFNQPFFRQL